LRKIQVAEPYRAACIYIEQTLARHGYEAWLVGGSVRDLLISGKLDDLDYTTNARPEKVQKIFPRTIPVGIKYGTIIVLHKGQKVEITTYRADADYADGRRPDRVEYADDLATDIKRRDFTINGLAYSVTRDELRDHCDGLKDLEARILRTIGEPHARFREDGLRPIRGCRIAAKLHLSIEPTTLTAMHDCVDVTRRVAPERFYDEWRKTLALKDKRAFWNFMQQARIIEAFLPGIAASFSGQEGEKVFNELNLLKPRSMGEYAAGVFRLLEISELELVKSTLLQTKFPNAELKLCIALLNSPLMEVVAADRLKFKQQLSKIQRRDRQHHLHFYLAIKSAILRSSQASEDTIEHFRRIAVGHYVSIRRSREPMDIGDLAVNGTDLQQAGYSGKAIGDLLETLRQHVIEIPADNTREKLLKRAAQLS
jgi:tRNA nucleotidyltransferase/poly(A) polymerase